MLCFDNLKCIYRGSVKDIYQKDSENLFFKFSDRYSIYDWGQMPDAIDNKGNALAKMGTQFFKYLQSQNVKSHFVKEYKDSNYIEVKKVDVLKPTTENNKYNYNAYQSRPQNALVPLEVIFRFGLPQGSSFFQRANNKEYLKDLNITKLPKEGELFNDIVVEFSTKLEPLDRYLSYQEAQAIAGLSTSEFNQLIFKTKTIAKLIKNLISKMGCELWDGKFEFAFDKTSKSERDFVLVDTIGIDELRILKQGIHLSKEILRQNYAGTLWQKSLKSYKEQFKGQWKEKLISDGIVPQHLPFELKVLIENMYTSFANDLELVVQNKAPHFIEEWQNSYLSYYQEMKRILLIGNGGREHAIAWKLLQSPKTEAIYITDKDHAMLIENKVNSLDINLTQNEELISKLKNYRINLVIIGPEAPLVDGLSDFLRTHGFDVFGPNKREAHLEASKDFSKSLMLKAKIPTAQYQKFETAKEAIQFIEKTNWKDGYVIKADGLASGKGVFVTTNKNDAMEAIDLVMVKNILQLESKTIIIEERLIGKEVSVFALFDKNDYRIIGNACDYKRIRDNDEGPNTGGMGTYSPCEWLNSNDETFIDEHVFKKLHQQLSKEGMTFNGVVFAGLMKTDQGIKVLEFNVRFGDPETQSLLPRIENDFLDLIVKTSTNRLKEIDHIKLADQTVVNVVCAAHGYPGTEGINVRKNDEITFAASENSNAKIFFAAVKKNQNHYFTNGGRVLSVCSWNKNKDVARKEAYNFLNNIRFDGMQFRNDIAR